MSFQRQVTYTPRLLLVDLKGAFGYLKEEGNLYNVSESDEAQDFLWDEEKVDVAKEEAAPKTPFVKSLDELSETSASRSFDFESNVNSWVDYLSPRFHPRTLNIVRQYKHSCATSPFDVFTYGTNIWNTGQFSEDFTDKIRAYIEECDSPQGFQARDHLC